MDMKKKLMLTDTSLRDTRRLSYDELFTILNFIDECHGAATAYDVVEATNHLKKLSYFEDLRLDLFANIDAQPDTSDNRADEKLPLLITSHYHSHGKKCCQSSAVFKGENGIEDEHVALKVLWDNYFEPAVRDALLRLVNKDSVCCNEEESRARILLTKREWDCMGWLVNGKSNWEMSKILGISERTVKFHLKNIYSKLDVSNRAQAITKAFALGLEGQSKPTIN